MRGRSVAFKILFLIGVPVFLSLFVLTPSICYALLSPTYVQTVQETGGEWWSDVMSLADVKQRVESWFEDDMYNFDKLDDSPIVVAVIDSGIDVAHEAFSGGYGSETKEAAPAADAYDVLYRNGKGNVIGRNTVAENDNFSDVAQNGHGTHVAGIIATYIHWLGLEKYIKIMPIMAGKPSSSGGADFSSQDVKEGINFALENGADVVNMSFEGDRDFNFIDNEMASKAIFVAAAGNGGTVGGVRKGYDSADRKRYPAASENVIGVMNISNELDVDGGLKLSESSNYGDAYDLCAPGTAIFSAQNKETSAYISKNGTSMAAPVVAFASALALLKFRAIEAATHISKSVEEIREIVKFSSMTHINVGNYQLGVLDLKKLVSSDDSILAKVETETGLDRLSLGQISAVPLSLKVLPASLQGQGSVEWYVDKKKIGEGFEIEYTPPNVFGDFLVVAYWTVQTEDGQKTVSAGHTIRIGYQKLSFDTFATMRIGVLEGDDVVSRSIFESGKQYVITFAGYDNFDPDAIDDIQWIINGKRVGLGSTLLFTPEKDGRYDIVARKSSVGAPLESPVCSVYFTVRRGATSDEIFAYVSYALVGAIALAAVIVVTIVIVKKSRAEKK